MTMDIDTLKELINKKAKEIKNINKDGNVIVYTICSPIKIYLQKEGRYLNIGYTENYVERLLCKIDIFDGVIEAIRDSIIYYLFVCEVFDDAYLKGFNPSMKLANFNINNKSKYESRAYLYLKNNSYILKQ